MLAGYCQMPVGAEDARTMQPSDDPAWVGEELDRVGELLQLGQELLLGGIEDVRPLLVRAEQGVALTAPELLTVRALAVAARRCRGLLVKHRESIPGIWKVGLHIEEYPELESSIEHAVDESGDVRDSASPALKTVRTDLRRVRNRLVSRLERFAESHPAWVGDRPTIRRDRFVLPVRIEARELVPGVVHESSGTGHTVFVEPMETVEEQNRLAGLRSAEQEEIARILRALTGLVAERSSRLRRDLGVLARLDVLQAKKRFADRYRCRRPDIADDGTFRLVQARHPLLASRGVDVVPLDFELADGTSVVLISGPNAGGKTVALKTIGLLSMMLGCGMYLPTGDGTRLPVLRAVLADMGDEQSIDEDLSSFTAHVGRVRGFLADAGADTLVLLDEIGSSTSPEEGTALAIAVLETMRGRGAKTVATTHLGALKILVQQEEGMTNAAMGLADGRPTYRLLLGIPGESSALDIAARAGIPAEVLARARTRLGSERLELGVVLRQLAEELESARRSRESAADDEARVKRMRALYEAKLVDLQRRADTEVERLRSEHLIRMRTARRDIENLVREIREGGAERESIVRAKRYVEAELTRAESEVINAPDALPDPDLEVGDVVESRLFQHLGTVLELGGGEATVAFGQIRMQVAASDLRKVAGRMPASTPPAEEPYRFDPRLDIRGMRAEEADDRIRGFIDEACAAGACELAILHGKGTGVLQSLVREQLGHDRRVELVRFADAREGGSGVTLVTLRTADDIT